MKSSYIINEGRIIIRPLIKSDIFSYINSFGFSREKADDYKRKYKEILKNQKEDDSNLFFAVLKDGKMIGEVNTRSLLDSPCDAIVIINLPKDEQERKEVEKMFIKLCLDTYLYDDIYIVPYNGNVRASRRVMISDSSRRKTS